MQPSPPHSQNTHSCSISPAQAASLLLSVLDFTTLGTWSDGIVAVKDWLLSLSTVSSRLMHVEARVSMAFLFKADQRPLVWMDHTTFTNTHLWRALGLLPPFGRWDDRFNVFQVSCLCLEESVENDPCKFALTSRTGDVVETFVLHSSSPSVRQAWIHEINQILENQRNFLNGNMCSTSGMSSFPNVHTPVSLLSPTTWDGDDRTDVALAVVRHCSLHRPYVASFPLHSHSVCQVLLFPCY